MMVLCEADFRQANFYKPLTWIPKLVFSVMRCGQPMARESSDVIWPDHASESGDFKQLASGERRWTKIQSAALLHSCVAFAPCMSSIQTPHLRVLA
jgi:hypothetical protein